MKKETTYQEKKPALDLADLVHSFWTHENPSDESEIMKIFPDSFFKLVFLVRDGQVLDYFMTGLWTESKGFVIPPNTRSYGCRLRILAPEFLFEKEIAPIRDGMEQLDPSYLGISDWDLNSGLDSIVAQWEKALRNIRPTKDIPANKLLLSQSLYQLEGSFSASEFASQIYWTNRQVTRYLNKYLGVSLKKYLSIQKCYKAYIQIREGRFFPEGDYFDQAHFVKEIKKHTGETPRELYKRQNDRFIQLKNIKEK